MSAKNIGDAVSIADTSIGLVKLIDEILKVFRPYKPEVRRFRIDYLNRASEIKYLLNITAGIKRQTHRTVELPAAYGFKIDEVLDLDTTQLVDIKFDKSGNKWVVDSGKFPNSERFLITLNGNITPRFLNDLVILNCAADPICRDEIEQYWIHSAIKDVSILERIWQELNIDRINVDVRVGVERFFSSAVPKEVTEKFKAQSKLLNAIVTRQRNINYLQVDYRRKSSKTAISAGELVDFYTHLVSGEFFRSFVDVEPPFLVNNISPYRAFTSMIPESVQIGVLSDLDYKMPVAKGNLTFESEKYKESVKEQIEKL